MASINAARPACGVDAVSEPREDCLAGELDDYPDTHSAAQKQARSTQRLIAMCRILDAIAEMRDALDYRIALEDPDDRFLQADCQTWYELTQGLTDFLKARRSA